MITIYTEKLRHTPIVNSQIKFKSLEWRIINGLARNYICQRVVEDEV